ncbi:phage/plasmid primase, P4 family [Burkholderia cepacia]|uniref:phage/plasmid primase, P4 family n=1 Tax=Burkholderia cepacia TaxID=292 RepID=UPI002AB6300F|nr:phage/plasmid primase, P4 family [Burkholderia cepacia]
MNEIGDVLDHFIPDGQWNGSEYVACNPTRDDYEPGSFKFNAGNGYWADFATDASGGDIISYIKYIGKYEFQSEAAIAILRFLAGNDSESSTESPTGKQQPSTPRPTKKSAKRTNTTDDLTIVMPVPDNMLSRRPTFFGADLGHPSMAWEYRDDAGKLLFYQHRFDTPKGKEFRPLSAWKDSTGWQSWKLAAPPVPRPAYGLDRLAARKDVLVLFVEGEKSADAAQRLFPNFVAVTTLNGAKSPEKTDFTPFAGRQIYIAPDNDDAGQSYKDKLIDLLRNVGAEVVATLNLTMLRQGNGELPKGYDLADAENDGWTVERLADLGDALWEPIACPAPVTVPENSPDLSPGAPEKKTATKKSLALQIAETFAQRHYDGHLVHLGNQFRAYENGCWNALDLDCDVKQRLLRDFGDSASSGKINEAVEILRIAHSKKDEDFGHALALICLRNGTLNPVTGELLPHAPEHYLTNRLELDYDTAAECPLWLSTLAGIFQPDHDQTERIQFLQEFIGYCLIPDTRMHKFLWLVGAGGNGKSLILSVIANLIGSHNVSHAAVERLENPNVRAELQGKLVNVSAEMSAQATVSDGYLKQIVSGDCIEAERKFEPSFSFKPYAKLIGATNTLPRLLDHSEGFARRAVIVRFNRQFSDAERDPRLEDKLKAELPGIMNWALSGLRNLLTRGHFIVPPSSEQEVQRYRISSDPVRQFAEDFLTPSTDKSTWIGGAPLYQDYRDWARDNGYVPCASNLFAERLQSTGFEKTRTKDGIRWHAAYARDSAAPESAASISNIAAQYQV